MTEYIKREEAIKPICEACNKQFPEEPCEPSDCTIMQILRSIPAADVRPVVLCRDCKHRDPEDHKCDCGQLERAGCVFPVDDDYYCAYGVKREESRAEMRNRRIGND